MLKIYAKIYTHIVKNVIWIRTSVGVHVPEPNRIRNPTMTEPNRTLPEASVLVWFPSLILLLLLNATTKINWRIIPICRIIWSKINWFAPFCFHFNYYIIFLTFNRALLIIFCFFNLGVKHLLQYTAVRHRQPALIVIEEERKWLRRDRLDHPQRGAESNLTVVVAKMTAPPLYSRFGLSHCIFARRSIDR